MQVSLYIEKPMNELERQVSGNGCSHLKYQIFKKSQNEEYIMCIGILYFK